MAACNLNQSYRIGDFDQSGIFVFERNIRLNGNKNELEVYRLSNPVYAECTVSLSGWVDLLLFKDQNGYHLIFSTGSGTGGSYRYTKVTVTVPIYELKPEGRELYFIGSEDIRQGIALNKTKIGKNVHIQLKRMDEQETDQSGITKTYYRIHSIG